VDFLRLASRFRGQARLPQNCAARTIAFPDKSVPQRRGREYADFAVVSNDQTCPKAGLIAA